MSRLSEVRAAAGLAGWAAKNEWNRGNTVGAREAAQVARECRRLARALERGERNTPSDVICDAKTQPSTPVAQAQAP